MATNRGLIRAVPLKDFRSTGSRLATCAAGTAFNLGAVAATEQLYGALHLTSGFDSTARVLVLAIQGATASGFAAITTGITFALSTVNGATWPAPVGTLSTELIWWRAAWALSTGATTSGTWRGLAYMGIESEP